MEKPLGKYTVSFGLAVAITSLFSALLVVVKELSDKTLMPLMKAATGHHWITHSVIDVIVFVVLGFLLTKVQISPERLNQLIIGAIVIAGAIIAGFYLFVG
jgi:hypothetical protein